MSIKKLTTRHMQIMIALVEGSKPCDVSVEFGITESRLSVLRATALWKSKEEELTKQSLADSLMRINSLRGSAVDALENCLESEDDRVKLASARDILDRTGIKAGAELDITGDTSINLYIPNGWNNKEQSGAESEA
jgi:hypothetical protein